MCGYITWPLTIHLEKSTHWQLCKNAVGYFEQILAAAPNITASIWPPTSHLTCHPIKINKTCWTLLEK